MKLKLLLQDLRGRLIGSRPSYKKYVSPLINMANGYSHATRPKHVGQVTELIRECRPNDFDEWREWYLCRYPTAIDEATDRVVTMLEQLRDAMNHIDRETVRRWIA